MRDALVANRSTTNAQTVRHRPVLPV